MEKYREISQLNKGKLVWLGLSIVILIGWGWIEIITILSGKPSFLGMAYIILFVCLLFWRYAVRYIYILTEQEFIIISKMLFFSRTFIVPLTAVESYSEKYVRSFIFTRSGMNRFIHRHSSGDANPMRIVVFSQNKKANALLFKASDRFMKELKALLSQKIQ